MHFLIIKLILKVTPERRKCSVSEPQILKFFRGACPWTDPPISWVNLVNRSSKTLDPPLQITTTPPLNFLHPPEKNMKIRPCFRRFQTVFGSQKGFEICKILQKPRHNIFADLQEMFVSLSSFVKQQQILNLTNQCSLFMTVCHIF
jgi:hypothetical protein